MGTNKGNRGRIYDGNQTGFIDGEFFLLNKANLAFKRPTKKASGPTWRVDDQMPALQEIINFSKTSSKEVTSKMNLLFQRPTLFQLLAQFKISCDRTVFEIG